MIEIFTNIQLLHLNLLPLLTWFHFAQQTENTETTEGPHFVVLSVFSAQEGNTFLGMVLLHSIGTFLTNLLENVL